MNVVDFEIRKVTKREVKKWLEAVEFPKIYNVFAVHLKVSNLLGSLPSDPKQLLYVEREYEKEGIPEDAIDVGKTYDLSEEYDNELLDGVAVDKNGLRVFRKDENGLYFSYGQITGWLQEAIRGLELSRKIRNFRISTTTHPRRIYLYNEGMKEIHKKPTGVVIRAIRAATRIGMMSAVTVHEKVDVAEMAFYLLTTNKEFGKYAENIFDVAGRSVGFGPGRQHGYGDVDVLEWCPL